MSEFFIGKKGQFYILVSLLLISYGFGLSRQDIQAGSNGESFRFLHSTYLVEGRISVNSAVNTNGNVSALFEAFNEAYITYAKSIDPSFTIAYFLKDGSNLLIGNLLDSELNVTLSGGSIAVPSNSARLLVASDVSFELSGVPYNFVFGPDDLQLKAVFVSSDRLSRRVFVSG